MFKIGQKVMITQNDKKFKANKFSWNYDMLDYMGDIDYIRYISVDGVIKLRNHNYSWDENSLEPVLF